MTFSRVSLPLFYLKTDCVSTINFPAFSSLTREEIIYGRDYIRRQNKNAKFINSRRGTRIQSRIAARFNLCPIMLLDRSRIMNRVLQSNFLQKKKGKKASRLTTIFVVKYRTLPQNSMARAINTCNLISSRAPAFWLSCAHRIQMSQSYTAVAFVYTCTCQV